MRERRLRGERMVLTLLGCLFLIGCTLEDRSYDRRVVLGDFWSRYDTLTFTLDSVGRGTAGELGTRLLTHYPYSDLWLVISCELNGNDSLSPPYERVDTLHWVFTATKESKEGVGILLHEHRLAVPQLAIPEGYRGILKLHHIMQEDSLLGIHDIGITLSKQAPHEMGQ